MNWIQVAQSRA